MLEKSCTDTKLDDFGEDLSIVCSFLAIVGNQSIFAFIFY